MECQHGSTRNYLPYWKSIVTNAYFGSSVSGAGDVNGDGYSDVIVGAPKSFQWTESRRRKHLYFTDRQHGVKTT
jgi:hypothetical protein